MVWHSQIGVHQNKKERINIAWAGMDAFCHAMEPFIGRFNMPLVHGVALRAIKLLSENLRQAHGNPYNDTAMENMAWAQYIASMAYNMGGGMGMVHGLAHMVSVLKDLHHGYTNAIMMLPVERFNSIGPMFFNRSSSR